MKYAYLIVIIPFFIFAPETINIKRDGKSFSIDYTKTPTPPVEVENEVIIPIEESGVSALESKQEERNSTIEAALRPPTALEVIKDVMIKNKGIVITGAIGSITTAIVALIIHFTQDS